MNQNATVSPRRVYCLHIAEGRGDVPAPSPLLEKLPFVFHLEDQRMRPARTLMER